MKERLLSRSLISASLELRSRLECMEEEKGRPNYAANRCPNRAPIDFKGPPIGTYGSGLGPLLSRSGIAVFDALMSCKLVGRKPLYISTGRGVTDPLTGLDFP
jgi:hypothetical protein